MNIVWLPHALSDLEAQIDYIAAHNLKAAFEQGDQIEHQVALLFEKSEMGRAGRKRGTRELVIARTPFIVVYRVRPKADRVEILRVLHGAQEWPKAAGTGNLKSFAQVT